MGLLKSIKKKFKSVVRGVKKGFKKVVGAIAKFASSKIGKIFLIALTVFTLGAAAFAAAGAFTSTAGGFLAKFVAGSKAFIGALASPVKAIKGTLAQGAATGVQAAGAAVPTVAEGAAAGGAAAADVAAASTAAAAAPGVINAGAGIAAPAATQAAATGGLLSRAAGAVGKFAASPGGAQLIGNAAVGYAQGKQQEEILRAQQEEIQRREDQYSSPEGQAALEAVGSRQYQPGAGYLERARRVNDFLRDRQYAYPSAPTDPNTVSTYARGPQTPGT